MKKMLSAILTAVMVAGVFVTPVHARPIQDSTQIINRSETTAPQTQQITITYNENYVNATSTPKTYSVTVDQTITLEPAPVRAEYTFLGWNTKADGTGSLYAAGVTYKPTVDLTLYAIWQVNTYQVTYDANGGSGAPADTTKYTKDQKATVLAGGSMSKTGYTFDKWNTLSDGQGTSYVPGSEINMTANVTLYAVWTPNKYKVTYHSNGAPGSKPSDVTLYDYQSDVTVKGKGGLAKSGYRFIGWTIESNGTGKLYQETDTFKIDKDTTLYAQWQQEKCSLTYQANGGNGSLPANKQYNYNDNVEIPTNVLNRTGYKFVGWNTKPDGSGATYTSGNSFNITADTVLYAKWEHEKYDVTYYANGGSGDVPVDPKDYNSGSQFTVAGQGTLTKKGYNFVGWSTAANGGTLYKADQKVTINGNTVLYARWEAITYRVTYRASNLTSGTVPQDSKSYQINHTVTVTGQGSMARTGYEFAGWDTKSDGTGTGYYQGGTFQIEENVTLYAQWKAIEYRVTYEPNNANGGTAPVDNAKYTASDIVTLLGKDTLTRTDYTFMGWGTSPNGGTVYHAGDRIKITKNTTLYAQWQKTSTLSKYTMSFQSNGGTTVSTIYNIPYEKTVTAPAKPTRTGYTFGGWYKDNNTFLNEWDFTNAKVTSNITLYAKWEPIGRADVVINMHLNENTSSPKDTRFTFNLIGKNGSTIVYNKDHTVYVSRDGNTWKGSITVHDLDPNLSWTVTQRTGSSYLSGNYNVSYSSNRQTSNDLTTWTFAVTNTVKSSGSSGGSGGGTSTPPYQETFWSDMASDIKKAKSGTTIKMSSAKLDNVPVYILELIEGKDVTLKITHGGKTISINGKNMHPIPGNQVYYTFDSIMKLYEKQPVKTTTSTAAATTSKPSSKPSGTVGGTNNNTNNTTNNNATTPGTTTKPSVTGTAPATSKKETSSESSKDDLLDEVLSDKNKEPEEEGPSYSVEEPDDNAQQTDAPAKEKKGSVGLIVGIVIVAVALIGGGVAVVLTLRKKRMDDFYDDED